MKKVILLTIIFLLAGCSNKEQKLLEDKYYKMVNLAKDCIKSDDVPFNIELTLNELTNDYLVYRLYLDEPKEEIHNIEAIVIHDYKTNDIFPTTGIYESKLNLIPNEINEEANKVKGIILIGYIESNIKDFKGTFKSYIKYNNQHVCYVKTFD